MATLAELWQVAETPFDLQSPDWREEKESTANPGHRANEYLEMKHYLLILCVMAISALAALAQLVVDATGPVRGRLRNPTAGHVGSVGRKLPVELRVKIGARPSNVAENREVEFIVINLSKEDLTMPVSPNAGDFEPADPKQSYKLMCLRLFLTTGNAEEKALQGGAELYGSDNFPDSLVSLHPGQSLEVRARVGEPLSRASNQSALRFVAHLVLDEQNVETANGQTVEETQEIGSATSHAYSERDLFSGSN